MTSEQEKLIQLYDEALIVVEQWRNKVPLAKATPNEIHLYNVFTGAKRELQSHLACIEDVAGVYMKREKKSKETMA